MAEDGDPESSLKWNQGNVGGGEETRVKNASQGLVWGAHRADRAYKGDSKRGQGDMNASVRYKLNLRCL